PSEINLATKRLDTQNEISYPTKLGFVEFRPFVGGQNTYYSRTINRDDYNTVRGQFKTGADLSTKFFRVYDVEGKVLGMEVHRLRHIITPSIGYLYSHNATVATEKLDQFDSIDTLALSHSIGFSLE